jgi:Domain of unknown function (DUF4296)
MWLRSDKIPALIIILSMMTGLLCFSCGKEEPRKDILTQDELTKLMIEFYLGEARLSNLAIPYDSASKLFIPFEESVMKKYGVSDSTLYKTYQYYFDHPTELEKVYEIVIDSLSLRERKATSVADRAK